MSPASIAASIIFLAVSLTLLQIIRCGAASDDDDTTYDLVSKDCLPTINVESSNIYDGLFEMNHLLTKLRSRAVNNGGFFNGMLRSSSADTPTPATLFGMAMCQADISWPDQCDRCLQAASTEAPKACPWTGNAAVIYRGCVLCYSELPIQGVADEDWRNNPNYTQNQYAGSVVPDTANFLQTRKDLFADLASAAKSAPLMMASGNRTFNGTHRMYGLAQCIRDLPRELCSDLITKSIENIPIVGTDLQWSEGVSISGYSFYVRYDLTPFGVYMPSTRTVPSQRQTVKDGPSQRQPVKDGPSQAETKKGGLIQRVEAIVIPVSFLIIFFLVAFIVMRHYEKKRKMRHFQNVTGLKDFSFGDIKSATKNFDKEKLLGEGGFGKVYKGTFNIDHDTKELAVKCFTYPSAAKELKNELKMLAELKHKNVVKLVGFCNNDGWFRRGRGLYVCSELISNGSLDKKIFGSLGQPVIEWPIRYQIICGICDGLRYLHQERDDNILHMDLKPGNILLDEDMKPKIADFGLSRAFLNAKTHTYTDIVKGSLGYMAPEFVDNGRASRQCDIYSLGMLILGIVMRAGPPSTGRDPSGVFFINKVREKFIVDSEATTTLKKCTAKDHEQLKKDASLQDDDCIVDVQKCVGLAFECVNEDPKKRPEAADICTLLNQDNRAHTSFTSEPAANVICSSVEIKVC